ncbi:MAG: DUF3352 domain-containing protein [Synechococcaceae cyanobacterium SM2_3_1]|nr:DUF3352 domain-containing protein [Synechococcaceae cyanobacterium SM2_3_1]
MLPRRIFYGILTVLILLTAQIGGAALWLASQSPLSLLQATSTLPEAIRLVPRTTRGLAAFTLPPTQVRPFLEAASDPRQRRAIHHAWDRFFSKRGPGIVGDLMAAGDIQFSREILPWMNDEVVVAQLPIAKSAAESEDGTLIVLTSKNPDQSSLFLNLFWQYQELSGELFTRDIYKGVEITTAPVENTSRQVSLAALGNQYVLVSDHSEFIREAVDSWQLPQLSIANDRQLQTTFEQLKEAQGGWVYLPLRETGSGLSSLGLAWRPIVHSHLLQGIRLEELAAQTQLLWELPAGIANQFLSLPTTGLSLLNTVPDRVGLLLSGAALPLLQKTLPSSESWMEWINSLQTITGFENLGTLLPALQGEYVLALTPPSGSSHRHPDHLDLFMVAAVNDTVQQVASDLDEHMLGQGLTAISVSLAQPQWGTATAWVEKSLAQDLAPLVLGQAAPSSPIPQLLEGAVDQDSSVAAPANLNSEEQAREAEEKASLDQIRPPQVQEALAYHLYYQDKWYLATSLQVLEEALEAEETSGTARLWRTIQTDLPDSYTGLAYLDLQSMATLLPPQLSLFAQLTQLGIAAPQGILFSTHPAKQIASNRETFVEQQGILLRQDSELHLIYGHKH